VKPLLALFTLAVLAIATPARAHDRDLETWALALMVAKSPPSRAATETAYPGWSETPEQRQERYAGIARAAVKVGRDRKTIGMLLALSFHESGWARDVDLGPCYRGRDGKGARCDSGRAACLMQVRTDVHHRVSAADLFADREKCFAEGLRIARGSIAQCSRIGIDHALDAYAGGSCDASETSTAHRRGLELLALVRSFQ